MERRPSRSSDELAQSLLSPLTVEERGRLVAAMGEVERLLRVAGIDAGGEPPGSPDARWCLEQDMQELAVRFEEGFDTSKGNSVSPAEMTPPAGRSSSRGRRASRSAAPR